MGIRVKETAKFVMWLKSRISLPANTYTPHIDAALAH